MAIETHTTRAPSPTIWIAVPARTNVRMSHGIERFRVWKLMEQRLVSTSRNSALAM
ncbi:hypothetical protein [Paratractidigestivibacter sp.]|uniref:hypothetical protein n=1 Tax=Paratractidigestivibacter sp. TaxID=2847316 RepID=UPI002ABD9C12|nr:hypothetical protein [Paratractidigestivibacter sp.]